MSTNTYKIGEIRNKTGEDNVCLNKQTSALFMAFSRLARASLKEPMSIRPSCSNRAPRHATAALKHTHTHHIYHTVYTYIIYIILILFQYFW